MNKAPHVMEDYFKPGFKTKPAVHVGSQTLRFFRKDHSEQSWEGLHWAAASDNDVVVLRNMDNDYLKYWNSLMGGKTKIINVTDVNQGEYLSRVILDNDWILNSIKEKMAPDSKLMVFFPTVLEQQLAEKLGIPLHGKPHVSDAYGIKTGIRNLAHEFTISMPPGYICTTYKQIKEAIRALKDDFEDIVFKHEASVGGRFNKRVNARHIENLEKILNEVSGGTFTEYEDSVVVEGWLKSSASLCAHIEILEGQEPIICAGWEQVLEKDGITYMGAKPLMISPKAMESFQIELKKLAIALKQKGAIGSYAPDFLVIAKDEKNMEPDTCVLLELNARVPATAFPLEIVKQTRGFIGNSFRSQHVHLEAPASFAEIQQTLRNANLLINAKDSQARGVVPYNVGLLPWKLFDVVAMGKSWEDASDIMDKVNKLFHTSKYVAKPSPIISATFPHTKYVT